MPMRRALGRGIVLATAAILATSVSWLGARAQTADITVAPGRLLGATRFQLAWLDWDAPRPTFLTALVNPEVAHDVAAISGVSMALLSVSKPATDGRNWGLDPSDILGVDLMAFVESPPAQQILARWGFINLSGNATPETP